MILPRKLSVSTKSPHYDEDAIARIDKVFVDGVHLEKCFAYDMDAGWAMQIINGIWRPKVYGVVTVTAL
jgi:hypothetical protein